jgi:diguanylate cyclase
VSALIPVIATFLVALTLGRLTARPTIRRLRAQLTDATWRAQHDPLTGLLNRAGLTAAYGTWQQTSQPLILVMVDLDDFKSINDTHGHETGDKILATVGNRIEETADLYGGLAARLSGDEFVALLPVRHGEVARPVEAIVNVLAAAVTVDTDGTAVTLEPSGRAGSCRGEHSDPLTVLLRRADIALYHAKHNGSPYVLYEPGLTMPIPQPRRRGTRLRDCRRHRGASA